MDNEGTPSGKVTGGELVLQSLCSSAAVKCTVVTGHQDLANSKGLQLM